LLMFSGSLNQTAGLALFLTARHNLKMHVLNCAQHLLGKRIFATKTTIWHGLYVNLAVAFYMMFIGGEPMALASICWYLACKCDIIDANSVPQEEGAKAHFPFDLINMNEFFLAVFREIDANFANMFKASDFSQTLFRTEFRMGSFQNSSGTQKAIFNGAHGYYIVYIPHSIKSNVPSFDKLFDIVRASTTALRQSTTKLLTGPFGVSIKTNTHNPITVKTIFEVKQQSDERKKAEKILNEPKTEDTKETGKRSSTGIRNKKEKKGQQQRHFPQAPAQPTLPLPPQVPARSTLAPPPQVPARSTLAPPPQVLAQLPLTQLRLQHPSCSSEHLHLQWPELHEGQFQTVQSLLQTQQPLVPNLFF
jgi:hypothetical protein